MSFRQIVKGLLNKAGYSVRKPRKDWTIGESRYSEINLGANYSPWLSDPQFLDMYAKITPHTLVDQYRCYELWELVAQMDAVPGNLIEIGVWRGGTGALISRRAKSLSGNRKIFLCDTFTGVVKVTSHDASYIGGEHADTSEAHVLQLLSALGVDNATVLKGIFPDDFIDQVRGQTFCFVHIDVDIYQSAKEIFDFVWPLIPVGGVVVFDDYGFATCSGIPKLVAEYRFQPGKLVIHNLNGHAIIVKTA